MQTQSIWEDKHDHRETRALMYSDLCELFPTQVTKTPHNLDSSSLLWGAFVTVLVPLAYACSSTQVGMPSAKDRMLMQSHWTLVPHCWYASRSMHHCLWMREMVDGELAQVLAVDRQSALVLAVLMLLGTPHFLKGLKFKSYDLRGHHKHVADHKRKAVP